MNMGKTRQTKKIKNNRMRLTDRTVGDGEVEEETGVNGCNKSGDTVVQSIIEQIESVSCEDKLCGLQMLASVCEDKQCTDKFIKHKVVKIVGPLLLDKSSEVRCAAAGALRNLSACGSIEISEKLVQEDVMTPLVSLLLQYRDWRPESMNDVERKESTDTLNHAVSLLWSLCEIDETAVKYFNSCHIFEVLLKLLDVSTFGLDLSVAACHCLHTVSEDNAAVISRLQKYEPQLLALMTSEGLEPKHLLLQTLAAGLLVNSCFAVKYLQSLLDCLVRVLTVDQRALVAKLSSSLPLEKGVELTPEVQESLDNASALIDAQTIALEIITNAYTSQDDEAQDESDDTMSDEIDEDDNNWTDMDTTPASDLSSELCEAASKNKLMQVALQKLIVPAENVCSILFNNEDAKHLLKKVYILRCRACLCMNNLVSMLDMEDLGGADYLYSVWTLLGETIVKQTERDVEFLEAATTAMRAVGLRLASNQNTKLKHLSTTDLDMLLKISSITRDASVRANIIRIVGTIGTLFASDNSEITKVVGAFLLEILEKENTLSVIAEALDSIMDVFAEDSTDLVAYELGLVKRLGIIAPALRNKFRQEQKKSGEHHALMSTVARNINRFIKYKGSRLKNYTLV